MIQMTKNMSKENLNRLVQLVSSNPLISERYYLYNDNLSDRNEAWKEIAQQMNYTG